TLRRFQSSGGRLRQLPPPQVGNHDGAYSGIMGMVDPPARVLEKAVGSGRWGSDPSFVEEQRLVAALLPLDVGFGGFALSGLIYVRVIDSHLPDGDVVLDDGPPEHCLFAIGTEPETPSGPWEVFCHGPELAARVLCRVRRELGIELNSDA